jgi:hypothetical protein
MTVVIKKLTTKGVSFTFIDKMLEPDAPFTLENLALSLENFTYGARGTARLTATGVPNGAGSVRAAGTLSMEPRKADLDMLVAGMPLSSLQPYAARYSRAQLVNGTVSMYGKMNYAAQGKRTLFRYRGTASSDREILDSAALVADAYTAFLFGPSWLLRKGTDFKLVGERTLDGERCHLIAGRLSPGFGNSREDHFIAWIGCDSLLMRRFQFTLNGLDSTRGADVDVTFSDFQKAADGSVWPRNFVEYIQRPLQAKAHQWRMKSLKLDGSHAINPSTIQ